MISILPYFTKLNIWVRLILLLLSVFTFSIWPVVIWHLVVERDTFSFANLLSLLFSWGGGFLIVFTLPYIIFCSTAHLYLRFSVLKQNPISQLMLLHPEARQIISID